MPTDSRPNGLVCDCMKNEFLNIYVQIFILGMYLILFVVVDIIQKKTFVYILSIMVPGANVHGTL